MDFLWAGMLIGSLVYGTFSGTLGELTDVLLSSAKEAVQMGIGLAGAIAFWMGLMEIAQECGMIQAMSRKLQPVIRFLFPGIPAGHRAHECITANMIANMLGLGGAATPAGLEAMRELERIEEGRRAGNFRGKAVPRGTASNEMCIFLILNISSLQLIPVNMIALRSEYGSANPAAMAGPALLATACSTLVAVFYCKFKEKTGNHQKTLHRFYIKNL